MLAAALLAIWWRGPDWPTVYHAFDFVSWRWVVVGVLLNLLSVLARSLSWRLTINQALPEPHPRFGQVFSAFGIGLLGNAVLPARAGELARVAVLRRHLPHGRGHERDAARHGLRAPAVRPLPGRDPRHLGAADGEDPALGRDEPRHLRPRRLRPAHRRPRLGRHRRGPRRTTAWAACGALVIDGPAGARRPAARRFRRSARRSSSASAG